MGVDLPGRRPRTEFTAIPAGVGLLRALAGGLLLPVHLTDDALIAVSRKRRKLTHRCDAEMMRRHGYPAKPERHVSL